MNAEELKLIADTITSLGAQGKDAFIWWVIAKYGTSLLSTVMLAALVIGVVWLITKTVTRIHAPPEADFTNQVDALYHHANKVWLTQRMSTDASTAAYEVRNFIRSKLITMGGRDPS